MSKQRMVDARALIEQQRYPEARALLKTVNHPTARLWLHKLDAIAHRQAGATQEFTDWEATQVVVVSGGVRQLGLSQDDVDFLTGVHQRFIEEALRDAQAQIKRSPRIIATMSPESDLTPALELKASVYAVSAPISALLAEASSVWRTMICLEDELEEVRASLKVIHMLGPVVK